jgi:hypothetical protein
MNHLTKAEIIDLVESSPALPAARLRHAATCPECRAEADALRSVLARALTDDVPPPSPLFWDHFSSRVSQAVGREGQAAGNAPVSAWLRHRPARWIAAGTMAALVILGVLWRPTVYAPVEVRTPSPAATPDARSAPSSSPANVEADDAGEDAAWAIVRAAAEGLHPDDAHAAGLNARPATIEGLALELSAAERTELARLLDEELKRNGV